MQVTARQTVQHVSAYQDFVLPLDHELRASPALASILLPATSPFTNPNQVFTSFRIGLHISLAQKGNNLIEPLMQPIKPDPVLPGLKAPSLPFEVEMYRMPPECA